jgi:hypothetical protein
MEGRGLGVGVVLGALSGWLRRSLRHPKVRLTKNFEAKPKSKN